MSKNARLQNNANELYIIIEMTADEMGTNLRRKIFRVERRMNGLEKHRLFYVRSQSLNFNDIYITMCHLEQCIGHRMKNRKE